MSSGEMNIVEWSPELTVNVAVIDHEHQTVIRAMNRFHQAMIAGEEHGKLEKSLAELVRIMLDHFKHEEALMTEMGYPGTREHIRKHEEMRRKLGEFQQLRQSGGTGITIDLTVFLGFWIKDHLLSVDRKLGEYIRATGSGRSNVLARRGGPGRAQ
jgi:hemerythrin